MPRPTIDYLNARRALKPASGGTNYRAREKPVYAEDVELKDRQPFALRVDDGLYAALKAAGGVRALARLLGLNPQSIYQWGRGGMPHVPAKWIIQIETVTDVSRNILRPDLYEGWERQTRRRSLSRRRKPKPKAPGWPGWRLQNYRAHRWQQYTYAQFLEMAAKGEVKARPIGFFEAGPQ
jgi:DNA-binding transcriptional regulator YdaS (Cro superfamily)